MTQTSGVAGTRADPRKIIKARGLLMAKLERDITWTDFAQMSGISTGTLSGLLNGRSSGNAYSFNAILNTINRHGVAMSADELTGQ